MPKFCRQPDDALQRACFLDRFDAAARRRLRGVEYLFPYAVPEGAARRRARGNGLTQVLHNLPAGDWEAGERGIACLPDRVGRVPGRRRHGDRLRARARLPAGQLPRRHRAARRRCGARAADPRRQPALRGRRARGGRHPPADRADQHVRHPGLLPDRVGQGARDHRTRSARTTCSSSTTSTTAAHGGRACSRRSARIKDRIAHIQLADNPGRNEPGTGEINYPVPVRGARRGGLRGWIGCEYKPKAATSAGLGWFAPYRAARASAA